eukprot:CAMPEP_0179240022 /NCGR_PEP_ID=MMETSP0797-20121207/15762_1 /TAXON_ID=47934 /ORGANISM="Dinophysis acuminata, Strain DAEP01" /LENGTH=696 /DNA_ID=CAMNT_0020947363 /DNA_START=27 /DNA_END=2114 /DNA_ORIENTATION=+
MRPPKGGGAAGRDQDQVVDEEFRKALQGAADINEMGNNAFNKGEYYRALDFYGQALKRLETLGETEEDRRRGLRGAIHYSRARSYYKIEDFRRAAEEARCCLEVDPRHTKAKKIMEELTPNLLEAKLGHGMKSKVTEVDFEEEEAPHKKSANRIVTGLLQLKDEGNAVLLKGNAREAIAIYTKAINCLDEVKHELTPLNQSALKATLFANRSQAYINMQQWDDAFRDAEASLAVQPDNPKAIHRREVAEQGMTSLKGIRDHGEALKNALSHKGAGNKHLSEGEGKAAAAAYTNGLDWLEDLPSTDEKVRDVRVALLSNRAQAHLKQKRWQDALKDAEAVLKLEPNHSKAKFRRAKAFVELQRFDQAVEELRQIERNEPKNEDVKELLRRAEASAAEAARGTPPAQPQDRGAGKGRAPQKEMSLHTGDQVRVSEGFMVDIDRGDENVDVLVKGMTGKVISVESNGNAVVEFGSDLRKIDKTDFKKLVKVKQAKAQSFEDDVKRLMHESEAAFEAERHLEALQRTEALVTLLEAKTAMAALPQEPLSKAELMWRPQLRDAPPVDGAQESKQLLAAYAQKARCQLALRAFGTARETADRAVKLYRWEDGRLRDSFDLPGGLRSTAPMVELLEAVSTAVGLLEGGDVAAVSGRSAEAVDLATQALRLLEKRDWAASITLRAELLALRAGAALRGGDRGAG